jgi:3-keto-disaccharide hydrolase
MLRVILSLMLISFVLIGCQTADQKSCSKEGWISMFDGQSLAGWEANEKENCFTVKDGAIVVHDGRSHLFYVGPDGVAGFKNFEFKADVMAEPGANSGIYFHTRKEDSGWPSAGYECQVNNTHSDWRKTGSLYAVEDIREDVIKKIPLKDNEWFHYYIKVEGKHILIKINDQTLIDYTEPENVNYPNMAGRKIATGTFALQGHDPKSVVHFKNLMVRPLP